MGNSSSRQAGEALLEGLQEGKPDQIAKTVCSHPNVLKATIRWRDGFKALHIVAEKGDLPLLQTLLDAAATTIQKEKKYKINSQALHNQLLKLLEQETNTGQTVLMVAVAAGHHNVADHLLRLGASVWAKENELAGMLHCIHYAAKNGDLKMLDLLFTYDKPHPSNATLKMIEAYSRSGFKALHYAAWNNHADCVKALLAHSAAVAPRCWYPFREDIVCAHFSTPLHLAAQRGHVQVIKEILREWANRWGPGTQGERPVRADPRRVPDGLGEWPCWTAVRHRQNAVVAMLNPDTPIADVFDPTNPLDRVMGPPKLREYASLALHAHLTAQLEALVAHFKALENCDSTGASNHAGGVPISIHASSASNVIGSVSSAAPATYDKQVPSHGEAGALPGHDQPPGLALPVLHPSPSGLMRRPTSRRGAALSLRFADSFRSFSKRYSAAYTEFRTPAQGIPEEDGNDDVLQTVKSMVDMQEEELQGALQAIRVLRLTQGVMASLEPEAVSDLDLPPAQTMASRELPTVPESSSDVQSAPASQTFQSIGSGQASVLLEADTHSHATTTMELEAHTATATTPANVLYVTQPSISSDSNVAASLPSPFASTTLEAWHSDTLHADCQDLAAAGSSRAPSQGIGQPPASTAAGTPSANEAPTTIAASAPPMTSDQPTSAFQHSDASKAPGAEDINKDPFAARSGWSAPSLTSQVSAQLKPSHHRQLSSHAQSLGSKSSCLTSHGSRLASRLSVVGVKPSMPIVTALQSLQSLVSQRSTAIQGNSSNAAAVAQPLIMATVVDQIQTSNQAALDEDLDDESCPVCLDEGHMLRLKACGHMLCVDCSLELVKLHSFKPALCPLCRGIIGGFTRAS